MQDVRFQNSYLKLELESDADQSVFREIFLDRDYLMCEDVIKKAKVILDIGAHIGLFSIYCRCLNNGVKIFSYEPDERNYLILKKNLDVNKINGVKIKNLAIFDKCGELEFFNRKDSHNSSLLKSDEECVSKKVSVVDFETVFSQLERQNVGIIDLVKMDIEGAEFFIFEKMSEKILNKIKSFCIEYHNGKHEIKNSNDIINLLKKNKFDVKVYPSRYEKNLGVIFAWK